MSDASCLAGAGDDIALRLMSELEALKLRFAHSYMSEAACGAQLRRIRAAADAHGLEPWRPNPTLDPLDIRFRAKMQVVR
jgi:hypothetical protein